MSITAIISADLRTQGWQARVYVIKGHPYLTKFYAWAKWGGRAKSYKLAQKAHADLERQARRLRRKLTQR